MVCEKIKNYTFLEVKPYLAKFLLAEENRNIDESGSIILTRTRVIPNFMISLLKRKRKIKEKKCRKTVGTIIKCLLPSDLSHNDGSIFFDYESEQRLNSFLYNLFHYKLELFIQAKKIDRKAAIPEFLIMYDIVPDEDVSMDAINKSNYRYRQEYNFLPDK